jgi:hypothetical protein
MIQRHDEMSPGLHLRSFANPAPSPRSLQARTRMARPGERYSGTDRYASWPCGSGEAYEFCRGVKGR